MENIEGTTARTITFSIPPMIRGRAATDIRRFNSGTDVEVIRTNTDGTALIRVTGTRYQQNVNINEVIPA